MINKRRKITREIFPSYQNPKIQWVGKVLRVVCYKRSVLKLEHPVFGVVVSKKYYTTVVERNLFKRRVFEVIMGVTPSLDQGQFDRFVISPLVAVEHISYELIVQDIQRLVLETC